MNIPFTISGLRRVGLTQAQIADAVGLKQPTISDMESGKCGIKRPSHGLVTGLQSLADKHGVATDPVRNIAAKPPKKPKPKRP